MATGKSFQDFVATLKAYWAKQGCSLIEPYDLEKGAGTFNPATFFGSLTDKPVKVAYVEPSRRPTDGRYGENPNRLSRYYQYQVILKPVPADVRKLYLDSLKAVGLDPARHDVRWIEDDWESPTLGASGLGWEIWLDGMEVTQFTYFQQMAGQTLSPITCEITYGLERLAMYAQKVNNVYDLRWNDTLTYGDLHLRYEKQFSAYHFEKADAAILRKQFEEHESEARKIQGDGLYLPAYDLTMKCSHLFNMMDARGAISVAERAGLIGRVRGLAKGCAELYLKEAGCL
jgi:glycyl-tRNA synthetase alpha chain